VHVNRSTAQLKEQNAVQMPALGAGNGGTNMISKQVTSGFLAAVAVLAGTAFAQPAQAQYGGFFHNRVGVNIRDQVRIDRMQARVAARIQQGIVSGALTAREARNLQSRLAQVAMLEARYRADGRLSNREADILTDRLENLRMAVGRQVHDRQFANRYFRWF
jgi:hypothetical protein